MRPHAPHGGGAFPCPLCASPPPRLGADLPRGSAGCKPPPTPCFPPLQADGWARSMPRDRGRTTGGDKRLGGGHTLMAAATHPHPTHPLGCPAVTWRGAPLCPGKRGPSGFCSSLAVYWKEHFQPPSSPSNQRERECVGRSETKPEPGSGGKRCREGGGRGRSPLPVLPHPWARGYAGAHLHLLVPVPRAGWGADPPHGNAREGSGRLHHQGCLRRVPPLRQPQQRPGLAPGPAVPGEGWRSRPPAGLAWETASPGMGSAEEPEGLQLLSRQAGAEDACAPGAGSPGCTPAGECLPGSGCATEGRAMRTCCAVEPEAARPTAAGPAPEKKTPSPTGLAPGTLLPDAGAEPSVAAAMGGCGGPSSAAPACSPAGTGGPGAQKENAAPVPPLPEPCLKAPSRDAGSAPAPAKHVAFMEPAAGARAAELPSQEQPQGGGTGMSPGASPQPGGGEAPKDPPVGSTAGSRGRGEAGLSPTALGQGRAEGSPGRGVDAGSGQQSRTAKLLCGSYSFEVTPPQDAGTQDAGTQVDSRASLVSVALSPMSPPGGAAAFTFPKRELGPAAPPHPEPSKKDAEMQVSMPVETRSVATGPMTPVTKSPQASYPEVHVKGTVAEEAPEPIREVSWDEKGMTWEVYGASMEVEVLGMAIQKHLEKQIEEHGRQAVMTPQSTRAGSIKGAPRKGEAKRQPSVFRALLQNVRRPRCCSRAGPAME
ncbi:G protein-regulated inducer of neurite outgrowth 1 [Opisthocomus hoazin]|uniref:G protein-regulated inducer of neurite outgrowth 1 n=1 Tax=Opisthocomus hoazin TaxID=30419 RepID=UPI003F53279F